MAKPTDRWTVLEHEPIERLSENLWRVAGKLPRLSFLRVMTIARLGDGRLVIHSPIALAETAMQELEDWGTPSYLIVPNGYHRLDAPAFKKRYPSLKVFAPWGSRTKVAQVLAVDGTYEDFPRDDVVTLETLPGGGEKEGVMLVRSSDGVTVVLNDIVFNMDKKRDPLGWLFTTLFGSAPGPRISRIAKWMLVKEPAPLRAELERLSRTPDLVRLVVSHEKVASGQAAGDALRQAAGYL